MPRIYEDAEILKIYADVYNQHSKLFTAFDTCSDYYNMNYKLKMKRNVEPYKSNAGRMLVDSATDHIMELDEDIQVPLWNDKQSTKDMVEILKRYGKAVITNMSRFSRFSIKRLAVKNSFMMGKGAIKMAYFPRIQGDMDDNTFEKYCKRTFPIRFKSVHPKNIQEDWNDPPGFVFETYHKKIADILADFPHLKDQLPSTLDATIEWIEFWTPYQRQFFAKRIPVLGDQLDEFGLAARDNVLGFLPHEFIYAGFGSDSFDGTLDDTVCGILAPALSAIKNNAKLMTTTIYGIMQEVFGSPRMNTKPDKDVIWPTAPGEPLIMPEHYQYTQDPAKSVNPDVYRVKQMIDADISNVTPSPLYGQQQGSSGYQDAVSIGQGRTKYKNVGDGYERSISNILDKILWLQKKVIQEPVGVMATVRDPDNPSRNMVEYLSVAPAKIDLLFTRMLCILDAETPEQRDRRIMLGIRLYQAGVISLEETQRTYIGLNPSLELRRMLKEAVVRQSPTMLEAIAQKALVFEGFEEEVRAANEGRLPLPMRGRSMRGDSEDYTRKLKRLGPGTGEIGSEAEMEGAQ